MAISSKITFFAVSILCLLMLPTIGYAKEGPACFSQSQINCFYVKLSPFLFVFTAGVTWGVLKYEKQLRKISALEKSGLIALLLVFFCLTCWMLVKLFFYKACS